MTRLKGKVLYIGIPIVIIVCLGIALFVRHSSLPVGQLNGASSLTFSGVSYVPDLKLDAMQTKFTRQIGRTQNGNSICAIDGENPQEFVYVVGDMWQGVYRRSNISSPEINSFEISTVTLSLYDDKKAGTVSKNTQDPTIISDFVRDLSANPSTYKPSSANKQYGVYVQLKKYPGLKIPFLIEDEGGHFYLESDLQENKYVDISDSDFGKWVSKQVD